MYYENAFLLKYSIWKLKKSWIFMQSSLYCKLISPSVNITVNVPDALPFIVEYLRTLVKSDGLYHVSYN